jgi:hypothetical protein
MIKIQQLDFAPYHRISITADSNHPTLMEAYASVAEKYYDDSMEYLPSLIGGLLIYPAMRVIGDGGYYLDTPWRVNDVLVFPEASPDDTGTAMYLVDLEELPPMVIYGFTRVAQHCPPEWYTSQIGENDAESYDILYTKDHTSLPHPRRLLNYLFHPYQF